MKPLDYGRLGPSDQGGAGPSTGLDDHQSQHAMPPQRPHRKKIILLSFFSLALIIASAVSATLLIGLRTRASGKPSPLVARKPTQAISKTCGKTRFPALCVNSLLDFPGSLTASEQDLVHISFNMTLQHFTKALYLSSTISYLQMDTRVRSAFDDCLELLDDSVDALSRSLSAVAPSSGATNGRPQPIGSNQDVVTWLSAALTNHDTCMEGFEELSGSVKDQMAAKLRDLSELVSNCLAIFSASDSDDFSGVPIQNRRRLMDADTSKQNAEGFPSWLGRRERKLLTMPISAIQADIIVSQDGNGTYKTIAEAIKKAPEKNGKGKTVISGGKSVADNMTTFHTASFAATGAGFIARGITFVNWAGPAKHQAVALRVGADHAVVYNCSVVGYQDTLYVHSNRQFFRECDIYGTVDFIFGNAAVVFQNCSIYARKPMPLQKNTITAQNRKDPNQNTGISIHACRILAQSDLEAAKGSFPTYLGRPWKLYSRVVYMLTYMGDHIHPRGWLEWNTTFALDTLYYVIKGKPNCFIVNLALNPSGYAKPNLQIWPASATDMSGVRLNCII
ncbi:Pectinesterase PPE8B precursor, putative [Ricinus communis]|uniref:Pectinesterase n=1 Tax=Ricinus communis TaxID=3988 RepID=B9RSH9_RICCO|nr:Pectinesterase PPE8B precursor, putative [Ricinus communis]